MLQFCGWPACNAFVMGAEFSALSRRASDSSHGSAQRAPCSKGAPPACPAGMETSHLMFFFVPWVFPRVLLLEH